MIDIEPTYKPEEYEKKWYSYWLEQNLFDAPVDPNKEPYTILMPPPNVTSQLHMGHGLGYTIQDLLIRWKRMSGFNACWLPGTDHAGIATQMMVEKQLEREGTSRKELGREAFVKHLENWKEKYGGLILDQFKTMGFSCDWSRLAYTLDEELSEAVRHVFVELFNQGLIYRNERLVNWDTVLKTAISDDEVETKEINGHLWFYRYPIEGEKDSYIKIATTRPETMLGDTAVAVNPEDERFKHLIGKQVRLPIVDRLIPIVGDDYVKSEFGTGAVKITPAHDPNDFEIGKRHNLPFLVVMNDDGSMGGDIPEKYKGMDRFKARKEILKDLKNLELFDDEKAYKHAVPHSERSKTVIEPKLSMQWYVKMKEMAQPAADAARNGEISFYPQSWQKTYLYWLDNIQDWCISRQLWWGHRIPIWYCQDCESITTGMTDPTECSHCNSKNIKQDEDVLDTWFSSWLWPLSPFGWPQDKEQKELNYFNPSDVLVTGSEIIFLWVARMVMANIKFKNRLPFKHIYFNATVVDKKGRKFSKTLGNGIDPLEVVEKHGADAVRFTAISLAPLGGRVMMEVSDFENGARFVNKLWNASRFILKYYDEKTQLKPLKDLELQAYDHWLLSEYQTVLEKVNQNLSNYRVNEAVDSMYHFVWGALCDWGLECSKGNLNENSETKDKSLSVLVYLLDGCLRLLHPVMPFITEELWQKIPVHPDLEKGASVVTAEYPVKSAKFDETQATQWATVQDLITKIRSARQTAGIPPKVDLSVSIKCENDLVDVFSNASQWIKQLAKVSTVTATTENVKLKQSLTQVGKGYEIFIPVADLIDIEAEKTRLENEKKRLGKVLMGISKKMENKSFMDRAPQDVIEQTKAQFQNISSQIDSVERNLKGLNG